LVDGIDRCICLPSTLSDPLWEKQSNAAAHSARERCGRYVERSHSNVFLDVVRLVTEKELKYNIITNSLYKDMYEMIINEIINMTFKLNYFFAYMNI